MSNKDKRILSFEASAGQTLMNVGYGNSVVRERIVAIVEAGPLPSRRLREKAASNNRLVDATAGRKMRSLIVTDSNHLLISALTPQTLQERMRSQQALPLSAQVELEEGEFIS